MIARTWALLSTEFAKLKHTATLWLSILFPALLFVIALISLLDEYYQGRPRAVRPLAVEWNAALRPLWTIWAAAVVPLLIAMETVGLASPEHAGKHWKQLYTLPIRRWNIFAAKTAVCGLLLGMSFLIFGIGVLGLALTRSGLFHLQLGAAIPWSLMLGLAGRAYLASGALIAIQMWLSMRYAGFAIPAGAALAAIATGTVLAQMKLAGWWPWLMPFDSLPWGIDHVPASPVISPVVFVVVIALAGWRLSRAEVF
jgi:hypothetical protein